MLGIILVLTIRPGDPDDKAQCQKLGNQSEQKTMLNVDTILDLIRYVFELIFCSSVVEFVKYVLNDLTAKALLFN